MGQFANQLNQQQGQAPQPGQNISDADLTLSAMLGLSETEATAQIPVGRTGVPYSRDYIATHPDITQGMTFGAPMAAKMKEFYQLPSEQRSELQKALLSGGFYTSTNNLIAGEPDTDTARAYAEAMKRAAITGRPLNEVINAAGGAVSPDDVNKVLGSAARGARTGGVKVGPQGAQVTPTHPDDIRAVAMKTSRELLGEGFNDAQLNHFVQTYQTLQATQGGAAPAIDTAAGTEARNVAPGQFEATNIANAYDLLMQSMKSLGAPI